MLIAFKEGCNCLDFLVVVNKEESERLFYVPASYILYLSDFCRFLLCTCGERRGERGGWRRGGG